MFSHRSTHTAIPHPPYFIAIFIFFTLFFFARICTPFELLIGTGEADSFSYFAGKTICRSIKNYDNKVSCRLVPTRETADRLTNIQNGSLDLALVSSKTIHDAFHSTGFFQYITIEYNDLRLLMPLYRSPISLIARQDAHIATLDDLAGKRINSGMFNTLENQIFHELFNLKGWQRHDFPLYQNLSDTNSQDFLALKSGSVQAMLHVGMHPDNSIKRLLVQSNSTLIGLDDSDIKILVKEKSGFCSCRIDAGTYDVITEDLTTLAVETLLIASAETDNDTVEMVLTAINESKKQLQYAHPSLLRQRIEVTTLNESYLHPHPSAILFFQANQNTY